MGKCPLMYAVSSFASFGMTNVKRDQEYVTKAFKFQISVHELMSHFDNENGGDKWKVEF